MILEAIPAQDSSLLLEMLRLLEVILGFSITNCCLLVLTVTLSCLKGYWLSHIWKFIQQIRLPNGNGDNNPSGAKEQETTTTTVFEVIRRKR